MATTSTDTYTNQVSTIHGALPTGKQIGAEPRYLTATYVTTGAETTGDVINIGQLPIGARLLVPKSRVSTPGVGGSTATIATLGDAGSANRYSASALAVSGSTPLSAAFAPVPGIEIPTTGQTMPYVTTATTNTIQCTLGGGTTFGAGVKLTFLLEYLLP